MDENTNSNWWLVHTLYIFLLCCMATLYNLCVPFSHTLPAVWTLYCTQSLCPILSHSACCMDTILYTISVSHSLTLPAVWTLYCIQSLCPTLLHCMLYGHSTVSVSHSLTFSLLSGHSTPSLTLCQQYGHCTTSDILLFPSKSILPLVCILTVSCPATPKSASLA